MKSKPNRLIKIYKEKYDNLKFLSNNKINLTYEKNNKPSHLLI